MKFDTRNYPNFQETPEEMSACCFLNCNKNWCWWTPNQEALSVLFCNETSIHGVKFLGQRKRHLSERIFWLIGFLFSFGTAVYLIYRVWDSYNQVPVIVSFKSSPQNTNDIPFPAVTLCNINRFPKSRVNEFIRILKDPKSNTFQRNKAKQDIAFVQNFCSAHESFARNAGFAQSRGIHPDIDHLMENYTVSNITDQAALFQFLLENTLPCDQLIRICKFGDELKNCSDLFKPIITDYGKCCSFNLLPPSLLIKNPNAGDNLFSDPELQKISGTYYPKEEIGNWSEWNYDEGNVLNDSFRRPWRQWRAGFSYGLSILVDPNVEEYYCPAQDSLGMLYILHSPLEIPHVMEFAQVADSDKEIVVEITPDIISGDNDIREIDQRKRMCYFGKERKLKYFRPYTSRNCLDECFTKYLEKHCDCSPFYMARETGVRVCDNEATSKDHQCVAKSRMEFKARLNHICDDCDALCEDVTYDHEATVARLQPNNIWSDLDSKKYPEVPKWHNHKMTIMHFFYGTESTVPKLRKRLYSITELIANTGGILGLCLGFSILSAVEVLYFFTLRSLWVYCPKMIQRRRERKWRKSSLASVNQFDRWNYGSEIQAGMSKVAPEIYLKRNSIAVKSIYATGIASQLRKTSETLTFYP